MIHYWNIKLKVLEKFFVRPKMRKDCILSVAVWLQCAVASKITAWEVWKSIKGLASLLAESICAVYWAVVPALHFPTPWISTYALLCWRPPGWMLCSSEHVCHGKVLCLLPGAQSWQVYGRASNGRKSGGKYLGLLPFLFLAWIPGLRIYAEYFSLLISDCVPPSLNQIQSKM